MGLLDLSQPPFKRTQLSCRRLGRESGSSTETVGKQSRTGGQLGGDHGSDQEQPNSHVLIVS